MGNRERDGFLPGRQSLRDLDPSTDPETIDLNLLLSFPFSSLTEDQEAGEDPMKPYRTR